MDSQTMKTLAQLKVIWVGCFTLLSTFVSASESPLPQRLLYVGHRAPEFQPFLKTNFAKVETTTRERFQPQAAKDFDVVLLDWPQSGLAREERLGTAPLGKRENWSKPTVLLGSAGLNLAVAWKIKGGIG